MLFRSHNASGWTDYCDTLRKERGTNWIGLEAKDPTTKDAGDKALALLDKIEKEYEAEDEAMMIRLIKARDSLWT